MPAVGLIVGAGIAAAGSIASGVLSSRAASKARRAQRRASTNELLLDVFRQVLTQDRINEINSAFGIGDLARESAIGEQLDTLEQSAAQLGFEANRATLENQLRETRFAQARAGINDSSTAGLSRTRFLEDLGAGRVQALSAAAGIRRGAESRLEGLRRGLISGVSEFGGPGPAEALGQQKSLFQEAKSNIPSQVVGNLFNDAAGITRNAAIASGQGRAGFSALFGGGSFTQEDPAGQQIQETT